MANVIGAILMIMFLVLIIFHAILIIGVRDGKAQIIDQLKEENKKLKERLNNRKLGPRR